MEFRTEFYGDLFSDGVLDSANSLCFDEQLDDMLADTIRSENIFSLTEGNRDIKEEINFTTVNPDDFLNDVTSTDSKLWDSPHIASSQESSSSSLSNDIFQNFALNPHGIETPPTSPEDMISTPIPSSHARLSKIHTDTGQTNSLPGGTLIPISALAIATIPVRNTNSSRLQHQESVLYAPNIKKLEQSPLVISPHENMLIAKCSPGNVNGVLKYSILKSPQKKRVLPKMGSFNITEGRVGSKVNLKEIELKQVPQTFRGKEMNEKALKKQIRMIKNRESACLSRKKKKEYVAALEKHITELIKENSQLKNENSHLRMQILNSTTLCECKRNNFSLKMNSINRKNTAVLLAMVFMISLNFGNINNLLLFPSARNNDLSFEKNGEYSGRRLLWVRENATQNYSAYYFENNASKDDIYPICPLPINQTENIRLASELRKWIVDNRYSNITSSNIHVNFEYVTNPLKIFFDISQPHKGNLKKSFKRRKVTGNFSKHERKPNIDERNQIQIYTLRNNEKYNKLFKEINRQSDTFYVLSFNKDHILLPAAAHNKTSRPKMSFMLPAGYVAFGGQITLMQIDCEVINTSIVQLNEKHIPDHLRSFTKGDMPSLVKRGDTSANYKQKLHISKVSIENLDKKPNSGKNSKQLFLSKFANPLIKYSNTTNNLL